MIAIIIPPGPSPAMLGLDADQSIPLLPLGDRPVLQHIIESLVTQGITSIELILGHAPEKIEALLGNGDRWGCTFRYHLAVRPDLPYRSLKVIEQSKTEPWVLIHADRYPCVTFTNNLSTIPTLYFGIPDTRHDMSPQPPPSIDCWGGTVLFPAGNSSEILWEKTFDELKNHLEQSLSNGLSSAIIAPEWIDASTPHALLDTQSRLLQRKLSGLIISGVEREAGIWISRNVDVHPTARLTAPLYIGPNCRINRGVRLGPEVVISGDCIVDSHTSIARSLMVAGLYIGEGLELSGTIVKHDLLVNPRLGTKLDITESFLIGSLSAKSRKRWLSKTLQCLLAALLILAFMPFSLFSLLYFGLSRELTHLSVLMVRVPQESLVLDASTYPLPCLGADAWKVRRPAGWNAFLRQFLPGLFAVLVGRISFVGLPPKTSADMAHLPDEWRSLYLNNVSGLITESSLVGSEEDDETQLYLVDTYYAVHKTWLHDVRLGLKYLARLVIPSGGRRS